MIYIQDNSLSNFEIDKLLGLREQFERDAWNETSLWRIPVDLLEINKIRSFVSFDPRYNVCEHAEIVSYPKDASMHFHYDTSRETTTGTSITFLSDDFLGGEAMVEGVLIKPIKGRTYYIDGKEYKHGVMNVIKGERLTLSLWWRYD